MSYDVSSVVLKRKFINMYGLARKGGRIMISNLLCEYQILKFQLKGMKIIEFTCGSFSL